MKDEKDLKKVNAEEPGVEENPDDGEAYAYCDSHKQRCMNDCPGGNPVLSHLN